jgi:spermidine/putrescine-binding protein
VGSFIAACGDSDDPSTGADADQATIGSRRRSGEVVLITWGGADKAKQIGDAFKEETGITLKLIPGENDADFFNKISAGGGDQYDVVISNIGFVPRYEEAGLIETLDVADFPVAKEIYAPFLEDERYEYVKGRGKVLCMPHQWGSYCMTYATDVPFEPSKPISWEELWNAPNGKVILDGYNVTNLALAGRMTGLPWDRVFSMSKADLDAATERLIDLKPFQLATAEAVSINAYRTEQVYIGVTFGLGFASTVNRKVGREVATSVVPIEGVLGALDGVMLLEGARNRDNALEFINFEVGERAQTIFWDLYRGPTANRAATEAVIARGGLDAELMTAQQGDRPDVAAAIIQLRDPDDPAAYNTAWDHVIA